MAPTNFSFNTKTHDFWSIYKTLKKYYPLGLKKIPETSNYFQYEGLRELEKLIVENFQDKLNYSERWEKKTRKWEAEINYKLVGTTYGQEPSFSAYLEIEKNKFKNWFFEKQLHFTISLIGPYYTIYGADTCTMVAKENLKLSKLLEQKDRYYKKVNRIVVSPFAEYEEPFEAIRKLIASDFGNHKFVPYAIYSQGLAGLELHYRDEGLNRIYHGLFNNSFDFDASIAGAHVESGDYGFEQWRINPNDSGIDESN
ncbi:MAG: hypothetical protein AAGA64_18340 [Bacteroidota bacterium]